MRMRQSEFSNSSSLATKEKKGNTNCALKQIRLVNYVMMNRNLRLSVLSYKVNIEQFIFISNVTNPKRWKISKDTKFLLFFLKNCFYQYCSHLQIPLHTYINFNRAGIYRLKCFWNIIVIMMNKYTIA